MSGRGAQSKKKREKKESWKRGSYVIKGRGCALRVSPETLLIFISNYSGYSIIRMPFCMNKGSVLPRRIFWWGVYITLRHLLFLYLTQISIFFWTLIYAGKVSNALDSVGPLNENDPEQCQRQGINQQGLNNLTINKRWRSQLRVAPPHKKK